MHLSSFATWPASDPSPLPFIPSQEIFNEVRSCTDGHNADYIPELASVNSDLFAIALCSAKGEVWSIGDDDIHFTMVRGRCVLGCYETGLAQEKSGFVQQNGVFLSPPM